MNTPLTTCDGGNCPSMTNCRRYTERHGTESMPAALHCRREAGASACDMFSPVKVVTTFVEPES